MPDAAPRPLTAEDVEQRLLADVAEARAQLAEATAENERYADVLHRIADGSIPAHGAAQCAYDALDGATPGPDTVAGLQRERDKAYRERARLVAYLAACYPSVMLTDSAEPDWPIVFVSTSAGQMSWHVAKADLELFGHVPVTTNPTWDGHTTEQKYERLAELTASIAGDGYPPRLHAVLKARRERDEARELNAKVRAVIARYEDDQVNALTAFADIMDAAGGGAERNPVAVALEAARHFAGTWRELLPDLPDSYACHMNCAEANAAAELYQALGDEATAAAIIAAHIEHDDEDEATAHDDAEAETAAILADPGIMAAVAEGDPAPSVLRDLLLLAGEDIPLDRIAGWSPEERARVAEWAGREHLSASDNPVGRRPRPSLLGGDGA